VAARRYNLDRLQSHGSRMTFLVFFFFKNPILTFFRADIIYIARVYNDDDDSSLLRSMCGVLLLFSLEAVGV
jgi:hypothetical protein